MTPNSSHSSQRAIAIGADQVLSGSFLSRYRLGWGRTGDDTRVTVRPRPASLGLIYASDMGTGLWIVRPVRDAAENRR